MNDHGKDFSMGRLLPGSWLKRMMNSCVSGAKEQYMIFVLILRRFKLSED